MHYTRVSRWLNNPPEHAHTLQLEKLTGCRYAVTRYAYELDVVWHLELWAINEKKLVLVDTLLSNYYMYPVDDDVHY